MQSHVEGETAEVRIAKTIEKSIPVKSAFEADGVVHQKDSCKDWTSPEMIECLKKFLPKLITGTRLTFFVSGSITVWLTFCFSGFDSAALLKLNKSLIYLFGWILTCKPGYFPLQSLCALAAGTHDCYLPMSVIRGRYTLLIPTR